MRKTDATSASEEQLVGIQQSADEDVPAVVWNADGEESQPEPPSDGGDTPPCDTDIPEATVAEEQHRSAWRQFSSEDLPQLSLREILGGDYLIKSFLRENIWFILFLVILGVAYITNRYMAQQEVIEEARLRKELVNRKYFALTQGAQLTMRSRQSNIERQLRENGDSLLRVANDPPYIIRPK